MAVDEHITQQCPSLDELARALDAAATDGGELAHIDSCSRCRQRVERLLRDNDLIKDLTAVGRERLAVAFEHPHRADLAPDAIPGYRILGEIHRGGQGVVYEALQQATHRKVAIKTLLHGTFATPRQQRRFEREIEVVASLQQSYIVRIFDSGRMADGRHYFVMEHIEGQTLDRFMGTRGNPLPPERPVRETLELFARICRGVSYAHQNGVIHRDLKPGNILVDGAGEPHILDFGLAKPMDDGLARTFTAQTMPGEFMGTISYASPEQFKGDVAMIDTRSDVYALGVILHEMLTGRLPHLVTGSMSQMLQSITEGEPVPPSRWRRGVDDEVDTMVLKALAKEPQRRYESAGALLLDIEHYLAGLPIAAKRASIWYVMSKALRRRRVGALAALAVVVATAGGLVVWEYWSYSDEQEFLEPMNQGREYSRHKDWGNAEKEFAKALALRPHDYKALANMAAAKKELFYRSGDEKLLDEADACLNKALEVEPNRRAEVLNLIGINLRIRGRLEESEEKLQEALKHNEAYYATWVNLGSTYVLMGRLPDAERSLERGTALPDGVADPMALHNLGAVQLQLSRAAAESTISDAVKKGNQDQRKDNLSRIITRLLRAKMYLGRQLSREALNEAIGANTLLNEDEQDPRLKRILALTQLRCNEWQAAAREAQTAVRWGDSAAWNGLILAIAHAKLGDSATAREHLQAALAAWPEPGPGGCHGTMIQGFIWIDDDAQLAALRAEAEGLITNGEPGSQ